MSLTMSLRAKRNPFGAVLHGAKGSLLILQRQVQLRLREPKTETMLAWGASFLLTRHVPRQPLRMGTATAMTDRDLRGLVRVVILRFPNGVIAIAQTRFGIQGNLAPQHKTRCRQRPLVQG